MGLCSTAVDAFFGVCSTLAMTVTTVSEWVAYVLHLNYHIVTGVYTSLCSILSAVFSVLDYIFETVFVVLVYIFDFLTEIYYCVVALLVLLWRICILVYKVFCLLFAGVETIAVGIWNGGVLTYNTAQQSAKDLADSCESTSDYIATLTQEIVAFVCNVFTSIGNFSTSVVKGLWYGIGYVPATIASFPSYISGVLSQIATRCRLWCSYAFMNVTRETYLGIVVVCLTYLAVSKLVPLLHSRGLTLFPFSLTPNRRTRDRWNRHFHNVAVDLGFESDYELDDADGEDDGETDGDDDDDADNGTDDRGSDAHTELTISDNDDSDSDNTAGSDSDVSLNSQTFSSEESENEIDIELPTNEGGYSLRSRSSTPSRVSKDMNHDDFEREMERERDKRKCVVCQDQNKSVLILPCKHMCLCVGCANQIVRARFLDRRICPLCRGRIERVMDVFV